jgi:hypothetical protein
MIKEFISEIQRFKGQFNLITQETTPEAASAQGSVATRRARRTVENGDDAYRCHDRRLPYSDEGPPIGEVATEPWAEVASAIAARVLRCSCAWAYLAAL